MAEMDYNTQKHNEAFIHYHNKCEELHNRYREIHLLSKEELESCSTTRLEVGKEYSRNPKVPNEPKAAYKLFVDYYAHLNLYTQQNLFFDTYLSFENETALKEEIEVIEAFIAEANKVSYAQACKDQFNINEYFEYRRFTGGYYTDHLMSEEKFQWNSVAASVYGRYVLFSEFLKNKLSGGFSFDKNLGFERIDIIRQSKFLPIEISSVYNSLYPGSRQRFAEFQGIDFGFIIEKDSLEEFLQTLRAGGYVNEQFEVLNMETIQPYFKVFAQGFLTGYNDFDGLIKEKTALFTEDINSKTIKVFEFISSPEGELKSCLQKVD